MGNLTNDQYSTLFFWIKNLLILIFAYQIYTKYKIAPTLKEIKIPLMLWLMYLTFFYIHTTIAPPSSTTKDITQNLYYLITRNLSFTTVMYVSIAIYIKNELNTINKTLKSCMRIITLCNVSLFFIAIKKYGIVFLFNEAIKYDGGITLITFSYSIIITANICLYLLINKSDKSKVEPFIFFIINVLLVIAMGKRGALLSIIIPSLLIWLFSNKTFKQSLTYIFIAICLYYIVIAYIDDFISILSFFNERLGSAVKSAYYEGDTNGRDIMWETAIEQFDKNVLWGYYPKLIECSNLTFYYSFHPHNIWLESLMTMGLVGSIPFFLYIIYIIIAKMYKSIVANTPYRLFTILFIGEIVHGTFSGTLYDNYIWLCLFLLAEFSKRIKSKTTNYQLLQK